MFGCLYRWVWLVSSELGSDWPGWVNAAYHVWLSVYIQSEFLPFQPSSLSIGNLEYASALFFFCKVGMLVSYDARSSFASAYSRDICLPCSLQQHLPSAVSVSWRDDNEHTKAHLRRVPTMINLFHFYFFWRLPKMRFLANLAEFRFFRSGYIFKF